MVKIVTSIALVLAGCTPGMHRAYQNAMGVTTLAGFGTASVVTWRELGDPNSSLGESKPMFGMGYRQFIVVTELINWAVVAGVRFMPDTLFDEHTPWVKDALLTMTAAIAAHDAWNDCLLTGRC